MLVMKTSNSSLTANLLVKIGSRKQVASDAILMLKAVCNYTEIFLNDGSKILISTTLGTIEKRLGGFDFFRVNRSTVVNIKFIDKSDEFKECKPVMIRMQSLPGVCP
ncbi:MAG: DNA-binding LytR/AlgR family response regulator [Algoriphagus sp.]|jgi:DNA-binding LytR/AlgR family response regulator